jgi:hypothetical protein
MKRRCVSAKRLPKPNNRERKKNLLRELLIKAKINKNFTMIKSLENQLRLIAQVHGGQRKTRRSKRPGKKQTLR